jgi:hypothetical protein
VVVSSPVRIIHCLVPLAIALSAVGCSSCRPVEKPPPSARPDSAAAPGAAAPRGGGDLPPLCARPSTEREVFLAQYAILYHVRAALSGDPVPGQPPPLLPQATEWLRCDPDAARRPARLRYAAVKLAAAIVLLGRSPSTAAALNPLLLQLRQLIGPNDLVDRLSHSNAADLAQLEDDAGTIIDQTQDQPALTALHRTCCPCLDTCVVGPSGEVSMTEFDIIVNRDPQCLFHVIDPQCWPSVVPGYFNEVFILSNAATCTSGPPTCRSASTCDTALPDPHRHSAPPAAGTPWCGLVYEDVEAESNGVTVQFRNVLKASTDFLPEPTPAATPTGPTPTGATPTPSVAGFRMDYGLCESIYWKMCDPGDTTCPEGDCPIIRDCGFAQVQGTGVAGWTRLEGSKHILFKGGLPHDGNLWAPLALEVLVKETAISACVANQCQAAQPQSGCLLPGPQQCTCDESKDFCVLENSTGKKKPTTLCPQD